MKSELKQSWTDALRSGKYRQCKGQLHQNGGHCCLGVLCVVAEIPLNHEGDSTLEGGYGPIARAIGDHGDAIAQILWSKNDDGTPFGEIADYIDRNL